MSVKVGESKREGKSENWRVRARVMGKAEGEGGRRRWGEVET